MPSGCIEKKTAKPWNSPGLAYLGAFLGIALATAHHTHHLSVGDLPENDAVVHIFGELFAAMIGGASLLGIVSEIRNRLVKRET
jgi:Na+/proline symporter